MQYLYLIFSAADFIIDPVKETIHYYGDNTENVCYRPLKMLTISAVDSVGLDIPLLIRTSRKKGQWRNMAHIAELEHAKGAG